MASILGRRPRRQRCVLLPNRSAPRRYTEKDVARIACRLVGEGTLRSALRSELDRRCGICQDERRGRGALEGAAAAEAQSQLDQATDTVSATARVLRDGQALIEENASTFLVIAGVLAAIAVIARFGGAIVGLVGPLLLGAGGRAAAVAATSAIARTPQLAQTAQRLTAANDAFGALIQRAAANSASYLQRVGAR